MTGRVRLAPALLAVAIGLLALPGAAFGCGYERHARPTAPLPPGHRAALVVGDSTGIFAAPLLARRGIEADARECRQFDAGVAILRARRRAGSLGHLAVLALGANGPVSARQIDAALAAAGPRRVLGLVTPRNLAASADAMRAAAARRPDRVLLVDWRRFSAGHAGWFAADGLHVDQTGAAAFARLIARRAAGVIAPPVDALRRFAQRRGADCGSVERSGTTLAVRVLRRDGLALSCRHARQIAAEPPLGGFAHWRWYDWRPAGVGPWSDLYTRSGRRLVVATRLIP
ncbi:MAG: hypothetical protein QOK21_548 [Solirubrobacteraceae bacterium]|jgi:hypothetical protein|nr:hypothetical protein [Solirubrobacteraceae bacterium]